MDRREFSALLAAAAASPLVSRLSLAQSSPSPVSPAAAQLYARALVLDCNSGPPYGGGKLPLSPALSQLVRDSGINVVKLSLGGINASFHDTFDEMGYYECLFEEQPDLFMQVRVPADMQRAKQEGKLGIIFSFESADMFEGKLDNIDLFRNHGVRVMQMSYNKTSAFAAGVMAPEAGGLTALGREAVARMNKVGVTIDLSHANAQTTADAIAASAKPVVMTHTGSAVVHPHPRNKSDAQLRAIADKGGVIGIYDLPYLTASPRQPTIDDYIAHMEHVLKVAGDDHVGIGSDVGIAPFDTSAKGMEEFRKAEEERQKAGLAAPEEDRPLYVEGMNTPRKLELVAGRLLQRGHSAAVVEKILGANFARVFRETWAS
ncbi:MAG TPA: membrane dipeptidase [Terriglobales bacterium]|nr:membrane dipeptidase [Terriglobales bacterium]